MSNDKQLNYVNNLQNRDQKLYYVDDASELNSINLKENDKIYAINDNKLFQMEIIDQEEELSGSIVSFNGRNNTKIKTLVANIEPQQDLHGYDNPWPAGGGANQWDEQWELGGLEYATGLPFSTSDRIRSKNFSPCLTSTNYYGVSPSVYLSIFWYTSNYEFISWEAAGNKVITSPATAAYFKVVLANNVTTYDDNIAINYPSTVTTYSPYSNECPISGWTGAEIEHTRKNLWDEEWEVGIYNMITGLPQVFDSSIRCKNRIIVKPGISLYCTSGELRWLFYDAEDEFISSQYGGQTIVVPANTYYMRFYLSNIYGGIYNHDVSINYPATDTIYHPYTGNQISVTFPTTIYGGSDEVIRGALESTMGKIVLNGTQSIAIANWKPSANGVGWIYGYAVTNNKVVTSNEIPNILSDKLLTLTYNELFAQKVGVGVYMSNGYGLVVWMNDPTLTTITAINNYLSANPIEVVYELTTPIEYTLTTNELTTFYGTNNIWSNIGDITVKIAEKGITAFELKPHT